MIMIQTGNQDGVPMFDAYPYPLRSLLPCLSDSHTWVDTRVAAISGKTECWGCTREKEIHLHGLIVGLSRLGPVVGAFLTEDLHAQIPRKNSVCRTSGAEVQPRDQVGWGHNKLHDSGPFLRSR